MNIFVCEHPSLDLRVFESDLTSATQLPNEQVLTLLSCESFEKLSTCSLPFEPLPDIGPEIRKMLRYCGFKPSGRSKPAAEYLRKSAGHLPRINLAVDVLNAVSFCSGIPISVIDLESVQLPLKVEPATKGTQYVFNASGQEMDIGDLLCLHDALGPCANAVKDSQRTKTHDGTKRTLSLIWGTTTFPEYVAQVQKWYQETLHQHGVKTEELTIVRQ